MRKNEGNFILKLADNEQDIISSQRLRYKVFVEELGANGPNIDHINRLETDEFDPWFDHLILVDKRVEPDSLDHVIGVYRLLRGDIAIANCGFYSSSEFDLTPLINSGRNLVELGRSCVHPGFRGGTSMYQLWYGLADYVLSHEIKILFGVASFHGTDLSTLKLPLSYLHNFHLAPQDLRVTSKYHSEAEAYLLPPEKIIRNEAMKALPALIKAYLRLGGFVGHGAYVDHEFNTVDVCVLMDTEKMSAQRRKHYEENWRIRH